MSDRRIRDVRDLWGGTPTVVEPYVTPPADPYVPTNTGGGGSDKENPPRITDCDHNNMSASSKKKYRTLDRHLSMKKTIRKKMMRDLRDIGDVSVGVEPRGEMIHTGGGQGQQQLVGIGFLEQIRTDQPPSANVDKPGFWRRLTKGWGHS